MVSDLILELKNYADLNNVPIIQDESFRYIRQYIMENKVKTILEIGTAIGYSAIMMALIDPEITVTSIERDEKRYLEAVKNVKKANLQDRITLIYSDALETKIDEEFDLVFIDAAKGQNIKFFELFSKNLKRNGTIITDNLNFHGLVNEDIETIESRNVRGLVRKIKDYISYLKENKEYETEFLNVGDGLAVSIKREG